MEDALFDKIAWIIIVNLALYFRTLKFKFVSDDFTVFKYPPVFKGPWHRRWLRFIGAAKLLNNSYHFVRANKKLFVAVVKTEEMEHFIALLIHIAICISIYFAFGASQASFIAALFYSTNPVNNQGTIWPGGRGYAIPILMLMIAMALPLLSPICLFFCSWFTIGFLAPLALIGSTKWYLLCLMPMIWFYHSRKFTKAITLKNKMESFDYDRKMRWGKIAIFFRTFGFYTILCIFPFRITFYHNMLQSMSGNEIMRKRAEALDRYFYSGVIIFFGIIVHAILNWGMLAWALLAYMITLIPYCNLYRANQEIAERFVSMPNVFLMFALAQTILLFPIQAPFAITAALVFYMTRTYYTLITYKDEYFVTEVAIIEDPHAWWAWHCRAMKRWDTQSYKEALILWVMAKLISPKEFKILMNIATCLRLLKNDKEADDYLRLAEENIVAGQEEEARRMIAEHRKGKLPILL